VPAYTQVNLNVDYVPPSGDFKFSITATNVGNVAGVDSRYTDPYGTSTTSQQYIPPRQIFGTITYNF
jgi:iron complex outermembrane receptor protein